MSKEQQYSLGVISPPSAIIFTMNNGHDEVMKITNDGIWVNQNLTVDEAASAVIEVLDKHIKALVKREEEKRNELLEALIRLEKVSIEMVLSAHNYNEAVIAVKALNAETIAAGKAIAKAKGK